MLLLRAVSYGPGSGYEGWCTTNSVAKRNLTDLHDLWDTDRPAHGLNGTVSPSADSCLRPREMVWSGRKLRASWDLIQGFEEGLFASRAVAIIESHPPDTPLFLYCKLLIT